MGKAVQDSVAGKRGTIRLTPVHRLNGLKNRLEERYGNLFEFATFCLVGGTGTIVDLFCVFLAHGILGFHFRLARAIAFFFAMTSNFLLNRRFTFRGARQGSFLKQYLIFCSVCSLGAGVNWVISVYLHENVEFFGRNYLLAALTGIVGGLFINFSGSKFLAFRRKRERDEG